MKESYRIQEIVETYHVNKPFITHCLRSRWVSPVSEAETEFDEEDLARLLLIHELQQDFGVNDEGIPIILHLLDQLHHFRSQLKRSAA